MGCLLTRRWSPGERSREARKRCKLHRRMQVNIRTTILVKTQEVATFFLRTGSGSAVIGSTVCVVSHVESVEMLSEYTCTQMVLGVTCFPTLLSIPFLQILTPIRALTDSSAGSAGRNVPRVLAAPTPRRSPGLLAHCPACWAQPWHSERAPSHAAWRFPFYCPGRDETRRRNRNNIRFDETSQRAAAWRRGTKGYGAGPGQARRTVGKKTGVVIIINAL